jgi:pimeloyl-ACP methyl ester carboxylesterase
MPDVPPIPDATQLGHPVEISFTISNGAAGLSLNRLGAASSAASGVGSFRLKFRTRVNQSVDALSERAYVAITDAGNAATKAVVKAAQAVEKVEQTGLRFIETEVVVPTVSIAKGTYKIVAVVNLLDEPVCNSDTWSLTKIPLLDGDPPESSSPDRIPLVLVHGIQIPLLSCAQVRASHPESETWAALISALKSDPQVRNRYELWVYRYPTRNPMAEGASHLQTLLDQKLPGRQVAIVSHSMGGLVAARNMIQAGSRVRAMISLSTPFGGTVLARDPDFGTAGEAAYNACFGVGTVAAQLIANAAMRLSYAVQLDPQSPLISLLGANTTAFASRLYTYGAAFNSGSSGHDYIFRQGGCLLYAQGFYPNDGMVPLAATRATGSGASLGAIQTASFAPIDHEQIHDDATVIQSIAGRLRILSSQIATTARAIQKAGGDHQNADPGTPLPQLITARVVDAAGVPVSGSTVSFAVTSGGGTVSSPTSTTDNDGIAGVTWRLGPSNGTQTVSASSVGLSGSPLTYDAIAGSLPPNSCPTQSYVIGTTVNGLLTTTDCRFSAPPYGNDGFFDSYEVVAPSTKAMRLSLATSFQPAVAVQGPFDVAASYSHAVFGSAGSRNMITKVLVPAGTITIRPTSFLAQTTGSYTLTSAAVAADVQSCELTLILPGTDTQQNLQSTDCAIGGSYGDQYRIGLPVGSIVTIEENSSAFDAVLYLSKESGATVASDDDGAGGTDALVRYTSTDNVVYVITATSYDSRAIGTYRLRVSVAYPSASRSGETSGGDTRDAGQTPTVTFPSATTITLPPMIKGKH